MTRYEYGTSARDYDRYQPYYGNKVKKIDPYKEYEERKLQEKKEKEELKRQRQREKQRALIQRQNRLYVFFLTCTTFLCVSMCVGYLYLHSIVQNSSEEVSRLQDQLYAMRNENVSRKTNLAIKENLIEIREKAINELGMTTPTDGQIIYYNSGTDGTVIQYCAIPEDGVLTTGIISRGGF